MHSAPPVVFPVGRFAWGVRITALLAVLTLALIGFWQGWTGAPGLVGGAFTGFVWLAGVGVSAWCWRRQMWPCGQLSWDGQAWSLHVGTGEPLSVAVRPVWDGQSRMLVQVRDCGPGRQRPDGYAWLQATDLPSRWHGLRCAVWARDTL